MNVLFLNLVLVDMMVVLFIVLCFILIYFFKYFDGLVGKVFCELLIGGNLVWYGGIIFVFMLVVIVFECYYVVMYFYGN